jgi:hypothetical protein
MKFAVLILILVAISAFIIKRSMRPGDNPAEIRDIISEIAPLLDEPGPLPRRVFADFLNSRVTGFGTITNIIFPAADEMIVHVGWRPSPEDEIPQGTDVLCELVFSHPDTPEDIHRGDYVEFVGTLIFLERKSWDIVLTLRPCEFTYIDEDPPDGYTNDDPTPPNRVMIS